MTTNQLEYWRLQEDKRHNRAVEDETKRANRQSSRDSRYASDMRYRGSVEPARINAQHYARMDMETNRHNIVNEQIQQMAHQAELARITMGYDQMANSREIANISAAVGYAGVGATYANIAETSRANQAREALTGLQLIETQRHNEAGESISRSQAAAANRQASVANRKQNLEESKWNTTGKALSYAQLANVGSQTLLNYARTDQSKVETELSRVNTYANVVDTARRSLESFNNRYGGNNNGKIPKGSVQWPDGSITTPR